MNESSSHNWQIEHQCPQCGAPALLEETDRILSCGYCRVRLYVRFRDYARTFLSPGNVPMRDVTFVPYWRFRGMVFSCAGGDIEEKVVDVSSLALHSGIFPPSLGFRPQALKLRFVGAGMEGFFLRPRFPFRADCHIPPVHTGSQHCGGDPHATGTIAEIGETLSLVYSPVFVKNGSLHDAVLQRPIAPAAPTDLDSAASDPHPEGVIRFLPTLCPRCGWDMEGERDAAVLLCRNCASAWLPAEEGFQPLPFRVLPGDGEPDVYLPFWRMQAQVDGLPIRSRADLVRTANLPAKIPGDWEEEEPVFRIPAFKVQPHLFARLSRQFTLGGRDEEAVEDLPRPRLFPVTLPATEAVESIKVAISSIATAKRLILPRLPGIHVKVHEYVLVYVPFHAQGSEWIQTAMKVAVNRQALDFGRAI